MANIFNPKKALAYILILTTVLTYVKLQSAEELDINDSTNSFNFNQNKYFKVIPKFTATYTFMKILIEAQESNADFALSYYKSNDNKRLQLSQSISGKTFIYLNKEECSSEFYIKIEFRDSASKYSITFSLEQEMKISLGEKYSYYVSKENQEMTFNIAGKPEIKYIYNNNIGESEKLTFWAKGSLKVETELSVNSIKKELKGISAHIVELKDLNEFSYTFKVKGNLGDYINIGALLISKDNVTQTPIVDERMEIFGFLKKGIMERIIFLVKKSEKLDHAFGKISNSDLNFFQIYPHSSFHSDNDYYYYFYSLQNQNQDEELYLFEFKKEKENINIFPPLMIGTSYRIFFKQEEVIGLVPMKLDNYKFLTYQTIVDKGTYKAYILECDNYPFCKNDISKRTRLLDYNSASISYTNSEYGNISPIDQNQKILLLECESDDCAAYANIYTEQNQIVLASETPIYRYIRKGSVDDFLIEISNMISSSIWNINLENISGNFIIDVKDSQKVKEIAKTENKFLYQVDNKDEILFPIKITANENTVYSITVTEKDKNLKSQINYLLKNEYEDINYDDENDNYFSNLYYMGFYKIKCNIEVYKINSWNENKTVLKEKNGYLQDFTNFKEVFYTYNVTSKDNSDDCTYILSLFRYKNLETNDLKSIVIPINTTYYFLFGEESNQVKYMYIHPNKNKKFHIYLKSENSNYKMEIFINDKSIPINENNKSETNITYLYDKIKEMKDINDNQPIKIEILITVEKPENNPDIEIKIIGLYDSQNEKENGEKEKGNEPNKSPSKSKDIKLFLTVGLSIIGVLVVIIVVVLIYLFKSKQNYDDLQKKVNSVSYKGDALGQNEEKEDDLLE